MPAKRSILIVAVVIGLAVIGGAFAVWRTRNAEVYQGRSIREWAMRAHAGDTNAVGVIDLLGSNAVPVLIRMLGAKDGELRATSWSITGALPRPVRSRVVVRFRPPEAYKQRQAAAFCLGMLGSEAVRACPALVKALADSDPTVSRSAGKALTHLGKCSVPALIAGLGQDNQTIRQQATIVLGQKAADAAPAIPALIPLLRDPQDSIRFAAALSLVQIGTASSLLDTNSSSPAGSTAHSSALMLRLTMDRSLHPFLYPLEEMAMAKEPATRRQVMEIMGRLGLASDDAVGLIAGGLGDADREVRLAASLALCLTPPRSPTAVPPLVRCLGDESPAIRELAAKAVSRYGQAAEPAIPSLKVLEQDTNSTVREAARAALVRIVPKQNSQ